MNTVGKQAKSQKLEPENLVPKSKWCVFFTQFFFSFSTVLLSVVSAKSSALVHFHVATITESNCSNDESNYYL